MIVPLLKDQAFLDDVRRGDCPADHLRLWWLGQSGFLVQWSGRHLLFDPYLSDSLTRKYAQSDKPHVRMTERVVDPAALGMVDVITSSHNHTDHLDADTIGPIRRANPQVQLIVPEANRQFAAERLACAAEQLLTVDAGQTITCAGFTVRGIPAAHEQLEQDANGHYRYLGLLVRCGRWTIYHSGDTVLYDDIERWLQDHAIDVAILPINGRGPERRVAGNLWGHEAAQLAHNIGCRVVIPCHFDMFTFNTASPEEFVRTCERLNQRFRVLQAGEGWSSTELLD